MCFVWISEQTAIVSLYSIDWLAFITQTESIYCAVRTGSLNQIQFRPWRVKKLQQMYSFVDGNGSWWRIRNWEETWVLDDGLVLGLRTAYSSDVSTFRTASIFNVSELVRMYTAVVLKKICDGCTERYEGDWQIAATEDGRKSRIVPSQWQFSISKKSPRFLDFSSGISGNDVQGGYGVIYTCNCLQE